MWISRWDTRSKLRLLLLVTAMLTVSACGTHTANPAPSPAPSSAASDPDEKELPVGDSSSPVPKPGTCKLGHSASGEPLPDPNCTPGAINPIVTQANIATTICQSGWTKTIRPPVSRTNKIRREIDAAYGLPTSTEGELDHEVSLELGGAPDDPRNLWVEPGKIPNPKDAVENKLNEAVCSGLIPLATAQRVITKNWVSAIEDAGLGIVGGKLCLRDQPSRCATHRMQHAASGEN
jgi:hypothetical protein